MKLSLFDLHCDTAFRMLTENQPLERNTFAVSLEKSEGFAQYIQVMALWIDRRLTDGEGWSSFWSMLKNLQNDPAILNERAHLTTFCPERSGKPSLLLSLEDARILGGDLSRVEQLYKAGIRILTPLWAGVTCIGGAHNTQEGLTPFGRQALSRAISLGMIPDLSRVEQLYEAGIRILTPLWAGVTCIGGAHNTQEGLTPFGRQALSRAISLGMIPDLSHASVESAKEILSIAEELHSPVIASHSNAYTICPVSRNLRDGQIRELLRLGGLIGLNFYTGFLKKDASATAASVFEHIDHFLTLGAEQSLALGGDMDGCDLPKDLPDLSALPALAEQMLSHNYSEQLVRAIFFENAYAFAQKHLQ